MIGFHTEFIKKKKIIKITYCLEPALELCTGLLKYLWKNYEYIV